MEIDDIRALGLKVANLEKRVQALMSAAVLTNDAMKATIEISERLATHIDAVEERLRDVCETNNLWDGS